jgi:hypothetical protein
VGFFLARITPSFLQLTDVFHVFSVRPGPPGAAPVHGCDPRGNGIRREEEGKGGIFSMKSGL